MTRIAACVVIVAATGGAASADIVSRTTTTTLTLPQPLEPNRASFCTWGFCSIGPRLYHAPRADGSLLLGWTDSSGNGHVSTVAAGALGTTHDFAGTPLKGLVAHDDGGYAVLLWNSTTNVMWLSRRTAAGGQTWATNLNSTMAVFSNDVGDSRLTWTGTSYAAYYTVYGGPDPFQNRHGDQLKYVDANGVVTLSAGWDWGCSHSMAELVGYHPGWEEVTTFCSSDCFPQKGLIAYSNGSGALVPADGNCAGQVSLQLGQMAAGATTWKVAFNALDRPCCTGEGIGLASIDSSFATSITWLTATDGTNEREPVLARLRDGEAMERYLVGWRTASDGDFKLAVVAGNGTFLEAPEAVGAAGIGWGDRDDSLRSHADGSVTWFRGTAASSMVTLYRFLDDLIFADGF